MLGKGGKGTRWRLKMQRSNGRSRCGLPPLPAATARERQRLARGEAERAPCNRIARGRCGCLPGPRSISWARRLVRVLLLAFSETGVTTRARCWRLGCRSMCPAVAGGWWSRSL